MCFDFRTLFPKTDRFPLKCNLKTKLSDLYSPLFLFFSLAVMGVCCVKAYHSELELQHFFVLFQKIIAGTHTDTEFWMGCGRAKGKESCSSNHSDSQSMILKSWQCPLLMEALLLSLRVGLDQITSCEPSQLPPQNPRPTVLGRRNSSCCFD